MFVSGRFPVAILALAALAAVAPAPPVVVALVGGGILVAAAGLDVLLAPRPGDLQLGRDVPAVLTAGKSATVSLSLHNPVGRPLVVALRDASPPSLSRRPPRHGVRLRPRAWGRVSAEIRPERRGYAALGPVSVRTRGPLGLAGRQATVPVADRIKVYPSLPGRRAVELRAERARALLAGARPASARGEGTDFDSLREYRSDDELRRINWRATARAGRAIANEYRDERNQQVVLLLDASRMMAANVAGQSRFDHVLDAAMAVTYLAVRLGDHAGMAAFDSRVLSMLGPRGGPAQPRRVLDALFEVRPSFEAPDYRGAFAAVLSRYRRRAMLVLLTELTDRSAMEGLFAALPALLSRHVVVVGSVADPVLLEAATSMPETSEAVYRKAAAVATVAARDGSASMLRRLGVPVEDRSPEDLAGALADRYLRIKSTGRL
ncbi:MAG: DUF58 domain-containing protein [Actinomycetota bacterium]